MIAPIAPCILQTYILPQGDIFSCFMILNEKEFVSSLCLVLYICSEKAQPFCVCKFCGYVKMFHCNYVILLGMDVLFLPFFIVKVLFLPILRKSITAMVPKFIMKSVAYLVLVIDHFNNYAKSLSIHTKPFYSPRIQGTTHLTLRILCPPQNANSPYCWNSPSPSSKLKFPGPSSTGGHSA